MLACLLCRKLWVHPPVLNKQVVVPDAQDPNIRKMDTGLEFQGQCQVHTNFKASLGYMTTCLKNKPKQREKDKPSSHACRVVKTVIFLEESLGLFLGSGRIQNGKWVWSSPVLIGVMREDKQEQMEREQGLEGNGETSYNSFEGMWV